jgi:hypothetical protein
MLDRLMVFPIIGEGLIKSSIVLTRDIFWLTHPDWFGLVDLFEFVADFLNLLLFLLLLFLLLFFGDFLDLWCIFITFLLFFIFFLFVLIIFFLL